MTDRQIIATLIGALRRHEQDWSMQDRGAVQLAIGHLEAGDVLAETGRLSLNVGGLCDNCGLPPLLHAKDRCPSEEEARRHQPVKDCWFGIVEPAREAYREAHAASKQTRRNVRRGRAEPADYEAACAAEDDAWGRYQAAIRRADRHAARLMSGYAGL